MCIVWNQSKKILRYGESCILDEVLFYLEEIESTMCHFPISKKIKVGRSEACDIQLCTNGVSRYHFQIEEGVLQDFDSLNDTYVNSKRVKRCSLCMQDEIVFANIRMIYLKDYVLLDMVNNPYSNVDLDRKNAAYYPSCLNIEMPKVQKFDIQMPQIMRTVQKQSLFSAIGPSCMIASSGFISSILIGYLQKQRIESLFTSMISSLTMAFTFMVYGLYNRNYQYKLSIKESTKSIDMYNAYIEKMYEKGVVSKGTFKKQMDEYISKYIDTYQHENRDVIYVGCAYNAWCKISYREVSYEYALDELMQKREQLISNLNQFVQVPIFLRQGEVCWIQGDVKASVILFENYLWYSKQKRKWVWVLLPKDIPEHVFGVLDLPFEQKQCEIEFVSIQLFYTKSLDIVYRLIKYFENETIYVYGTNMLDSYVDFSFFQSRYFSKIHEGVCIIFEDENLDLSELDEHVISFVVTNNETTNLKWILNKYVFDIESLDDKRIFFDTYHLPSYLNMTLYHNAYVEILYRKIKETDLKSRATKSMIFNKDKNCIGFECKGDRPVFMDETKKLFILYMHTDYVHEVNRICESLAHLKITSDWNQESDVYVVCVDVSLLNKDAFQKKLYNAQIVWVGYGLKEYGYMLKRKLPYEHFDCVFFKDQNEGVGICE